MFPSISPIGDDPSRQRSGYASSAPPASKPCEAPAGIARLLGALRGGGIPCRAADLNLSIYLDILEEPGSPSRQDTWTRRALKNRGRHLSLLRSRDAGGNPSRYGRAISDLGRLLAPGGDDGEGGPRLSWSDYLEPRRSPWRSADLLDLFLKPEESPLYPYFAPSLEKLLDEFSPSVAGISLSFLSQALPAFAMGGFIRRVSPGTKLVLGGSLPTSWLRLPDFKNPFAGTFDLVAEGPGEEVVLDLAGAGEAEKIAGKEAPPDYGDFAELPYLSPGFVLPYAASRGCSWKRCTFCPEKAENAPYRPVPEERVLRELGDGIRKTRPVLIHFLDSEMSPSLLRTLKRHPPGVPWYGFARISRDLEDPDFCRALRRGGCVMLKLGVESGDQAVLDAMGKGITVAAASRALRSLKTAGIGVFVYLLFGTPEEGPEEAERTLDFIAAHADCIDFLNLAVFNLPRGSHLAESLDTADFSEGDLSLYREFAHPRGWNRREVRDFLEKRFKKHSAILPILRRTPPGFGSNHAPFFTKGFLAP